jgi:hypothetical protein
VTSRFDTLRDQRVGARGRRRLRLVLVRHLDEHGETGLASPSDQRRIDSPRERDHGNTALEQELETIALIEGEHKVHAERVGGRGNDPPDFTAQLGQLRPRSGKSAKPANRRDSGDKLPGRRRSDRRLHDGQMPRQ